MPDSDAEATETQVWLDVAHNCGYLSKDHDNGIVARYEDLGRMIGAMMKHPAFCYLPSGRWRPIHYAAGFQQEESQ